MPIECNLLTGKAEFEHMMKTFRTDLEGLTDRLKKNDPISAPERELWFWRMICFLSVIYGSTPIAVLNLAVFSHCKMGPPPGIFEQVVDDYLKEVIPLIAYSLGEVKCECVSCKTRKEGLN